MIRAIIFDFDGVILDSVDIKTKAFARLFQEFGLPHVVRTDNGVPFAQPTSLGRLGQLALWWVRLGIRPEYIRPARPSENGAHERFHKTLKEGATKPASSSLDAQQSDLPPPSSLPTSRVRPGVPIH